MVVVGPSQRHLRRMGMTQWQPTELAEEPLNNNKPPIEESVFKQEEYNMNIKKIPLMEALNKSVYLDKYGVATISLSRFAFVGTKKDEYFWQNDLFYKRENQLVRIPDPVSFILKNEWEKIPFYIKDPTKNNPYWYDYNVLQPGFEKQITIKGIYLEIRTNYRTSRGNQSIEQYLTFSSQKELDAYKVWTFDSFADSDLKHPTIQEIEVGKKFYYREKGTVKVTKKYDYPSREIYFCEIEDIDGEKTDLSLNDVINNNFFLLPTEKWNDPLKELDANLNELSLDPYVVREGKTFNIFWKPISDASEYIVSLYRVVELYGRKNLYQLKNYVVDRNDKFLTIDGLVGKTFVFKVSAENRNGDVIAMSRGITEGLPEYLSWED